MGFLGKRDPYRGNAAHRPSHEPSQDKALSPVQTTHHEKAPGHPGAFAFAAARCAGDARIRHS